MRLRDHWYGVAAIVFLFLAVACGGGGGGGSAPVTGTITPAPALRTDLLFGYYGQDATTALETAAHANLYFAAAFYGPLEQMAGLTHAKGAGYKAVVLHLPGYPAGATEAQAAESIRFYLKRLHDAGLLANVVALYPIDEPDHERSGNRSDAEVTARNVLIRRVAAEFPELAGVKLAVIYSDSGRRPGIASYDWIGIDNYDIGCSVLARYDELRATLRPDQRLMLVPGGANVGKRPRQDPACFESYAHGNAQMVAIVAFIWQTVTDEGNTYLGIRENGMRALYEAAGRKIKQ
jgi:hypothetical protein